MTKAIVSSVDFALQYRPTPTSEFTTLCSFADYDAAHAAFAHWCKESPGRDWALVQREHYEALLTTEREHQETGK